MAVYGDIIYRDQDVTDFLRFVVSAYPKLGGSLVTKAWHILRFWMEEPASRYGG
jgi:hypothetical protein